MKPDLGAATRGRILYGGDYNPEQWPEETWQEDVRLMRAAGVNSVTLGVFSWAKLEPRPGEREFGWLDRLMDLMHDNGIGVVLATPTASPPPWMGHLHPDTLPVTEDGRTEWWGGRQHFSHSSDTYRRYAAAITEDLAEDGRCTYDELARVCGVSEATARRRLGTLRRQGRVRVRAVIEPALLALPVEAVLWVRPAPAAVASVTTALARSTHVRYASFVTGERHLLALTAFPDEGALHDFVTGSDWLRDVVSVDVSMVLGTLKRGGMPSE